MDTLQKKQKKAKKILTSLEVRVAAAGGSIAKTVGTRTQPPLMHPSQAKRERERIARVDAAKAAEAASSVAMVLVA